MTQNPQIRCTKCGEHKDLQNMRYIDEEAFCTTCLYEKHPAFEIFPIGFVKNSLERGKSFHLHGNRNQISEIHLLPSQKPFLYALKDEKRLDILFYLHQQRPSVKSVFHRGLDGKKVGVFASRTPDRLTPIAITNVELIKIKDTVLFVKGLDAINGTPILDIKLGMNSYHSR